MSSTLRPSLLAATPVQLSQQPQPQPSSMMRKVDRAKSTARSAAAHSARSACQFAGSGGGLYLSGLAVEDSWEEFGVDPHAEEIRQVPRIRREVGSSVTFNDFLGIEDGGAIGEQGAVVLLPHALLPAA